MTIISGATTAASKNKTWLTWFNNRDSATIINKSNQERLFKTFDASVTSDDLIANMEQHEEACFLHKVNFGNKRVTIFHHLTSSGGAIYDENAKEYGFIQGIGIDNTAMMTPDMETLKKVESASDTAVPAMANLLNVKSKEEVDALTVSATVKYRARNVLPVPPFMLDSIQEVVEDKNGEAREMLVKTAEAIKEFDTKHASDTSYGDKAKTKCKDLLYWLYLVSADSNAIAPVNVIVCTNPKVKAKLRKQEELNLKEETEVTSSIATQVEESLKRPFEVLAATSSTTTDFMDKLTQLQAQQTEKATKTFKKIPAKYQQMILIAASTSDVTEVEYNADAVEFFKCSTPLHAQVMLNSVMEAEGIECSVSIAMATTLLYGSFLWRNPISPAGLAASVLTSEGLLRNDTLQEGMVLDFATKFEMSEVSLAKLTKTQVLFPKDVEELCHRIRGIHMLASFFFKKTSFMCQGLKQMVNFCLDHRSLLKTKIYLDKAFIAKLLCSVDERIYLWLRQCSTSNSVMETELNLMNFVSLINDVKLNRFNYILPPTIAALVVDEYPEGNTTKRPSPRNNSSGAEIHKNTKRVEEWAMRKGESWHNVFRNKAIEGPMLSTKCHPCLKFHVRGSCYKDCKNKASHGVLNNDDRKKVNEFIKTLRGE